MTELKVPDVAVEHKGVCVECGINMVPGSRPTVPDGWARYGGRGLCARCYNRSWRERHQEATRYVPTLTDDRVTPKIRGRGSRPVTEDERDRQWTLRAACRDADPEIFYPVSSADAAYDEARWYCNRCPVRDICLTDALAQEGYTREGMRGGLTPNQRAYLARKAKKERS